MNKTAGKQSPLTTAQIAVRKKRSNLDPWLSPDLHIYIPWQQVPQSNDSFIHFLSHVPISQMVSKLSWSEFLAICFTVSSSTKYIFAVAQYYSNIIQIYQEKLLLQIIISQT